MEDTVESVLMANVESSSMGVPTLSSLVPTSLRNVSRFLVFSLASSLRAARQDSRAPHSLLCASESKHIDTSSGRDSLKSFNTNFNFTSDLKPRNTPGKLSAQVIANLCKMLMMAVSPWSLMWTATPSTITIPSPPPGEGVALTSWAVVSGWRDPVTWRACWGKGSLALNMLGSLKRLV